jgi:hypothetical protein
MLNLGKNNTSFRIVAILHQGDHISVDIDEIIEPKINNAITLKISLDQAQNIYVGQIVTATFSVEG